MDLISKQKAIEAIKKLAELYPYKVIGDRESYSEYNRSWDDSTDMAESAILNLDSVEAIPIEWIKKRCEILNEYISNYGGTAEQEHVVTAKIHEVCGLVRLIADWRAERKEE